MSDESENARPDGPDSRDPMGPPEVPCECFCLHCRRTFMSDAMWFQKVKGARDGFKGFWMCPTPNCDGAGFTIDIFPTDPEHPANEGWHDDDECDEEFTDEDDEWGQEVDGSAKDGEEWDPEEPEYKMMDQMGDDDIEGEEWKYGIEPKLFTETPEPTSADDYWREQEARYDSEDERPRELDWSDRDRKEPPFTDDDIPF